MNRSFGRAARRCTLSHEICGLQIARRGGSRPGVIKSERSLGAPLAEIPGCAGDGKLRKSLKSYQRQLVVGSSPAYQKAEVKIIESHLRELVDGSIAGIWKPQAGLERSTCSAGGIRKTVTAQFL